jgi:CRP-like cAMP-binding protein
MLKHESEKLFTSKSVPFNELNEDELILLNKNTIETIYQKGESIIKQGTRTSHVLLIKKGLVKISFVKNDQELVLSLESRKKILGLQALFQSDLSPYSAYACEEVKACLFDINAFKSIILMNPKFGSALMKLMNEYSIFLFHRMACLTLNQIQGKFAHFLLFLSLTVYKKKTFVTPLSKKDMALVTNMTQESLSRVIRDFISDKIIDFEGNKITVLDFKKIRHLSVVG